MNEDQVYSTIRSVWKVIGGGAIMFGVGNVAGWGLIGDSIVAIAGAAMAIAAVLRSWAAHP